MTTESTSVDLEKIKKERAVRSFPSAPFSESLAFTKKVSEIGGGVQVRRLTLFNELGKSPTSSASQSLLSNSFKYGLTKGSYKSEFIELTDIGAKCVADNDTRQRAKAQIDAAVFSIELFKDLYEQLIELKLPSPSVISDKCVELGVHKDLAREAVDTFIVNLRDVGLLQTIAGAERIVSVAHRLDEVKELKTAQNSSLGESAGVPSANIITSAHATFESAAFYITPIGEVGSPQRRHADMFASSIVEPAIEFSGLRLVRADQIESPGIITKQIIEYLVHSRLVIADLSFHNPNVFYELAVRHMLRKPTVQLMRKIDRIPFDVSQNRTVIIDEEDKYDLIAKMPTFISDLRAQVRQALDNPESVDNPISIFIPNLKTTI
ncbi:MAG: hypothetical protein J0L76_19170 [Rhodobacterales bacterium]|nr:hypothetical protein [Rhodobacterales bacterium]